jgi:hypothetical protein
MNVFLPSLRSSGLRMEAVAHSSQILVYISSMQPTSPQYEQENLVITLLA